MIRRAFFKRCLAAALAATGAPAAIPDEDLIIWHEIKLEPVTIDQDGQIQPIKPGTMITCKKYEVSARKLSGMDYR